MTIFYKTYRRHMFKGLTHCSVGAMLVGSVVLASCGSSSTGSSSTTAKPPSKTTSAPGLTPLEQVQLVGQTTSEVKTAHLDFISTGTAKLAAGQTFTVTINGSGDADMVHSLASFSMTENSSMLGSKPLTMQAVIANGTDYISSNAMSGLPGINKPWLTSSLTGESGSNAITGILTSPSQMLSVLSQVGQVTSLGSAVINGVQTTGYSVAVSVAKLASHHIDTPMVNVMRCLGTTTLPIKLWIDNKGRAIRFNLLWQLTLPAGTASMSEVINATYNFSKFGETVNISPPPASQTQPLSSIMPATASSQTPACVS